MHSHADVSDQHCIFQEVECDLPSELQVMAAEMRHSTPERVAESSWICFDPDNTGQATSEQAVANLERLKPGACQDSIADPPCGLA